MLEEIKFNTRGEGERDFIWFSEKAVNQSWREKYEAAFFMTDSEINLFVEIQNGNYRLDFDKIKRSFTILRGSGAITHPYIALAAEGKCGSESSKAIFKLLSNYFLGKGEDVVHLLDQIIPKKYIESVYDKARTPEVEKEISEKIEEVVSKLSDVDIPNEHLLKDNVYLFDNFEINKNAFFSELKRITKPSENEEFISLVITGKSIGVHLSSEFDHTIFSSGVCLTTGTINGSKPIEKTIKDVQKEKTSEPESEHTDTSPSDSDQKEKDEQTTDPFLTEGTTSEEKRTTETKEKKDFLSNLLSNLGYKKWLIISIVIILTLILAVKSCWRNSGNDLEKKSPTQKEQQSSPPSDDSLMKSTKDTLNK
ncbi:MAG: hypothetical protein IKP73_14500 [Bacteroidales bacterium]|nr:hypothetical protein [Bacteroidales bacterium]